jgi:hypothetical protein
VAPNAQVEISAYSSQLDGSFRIHKSKQPSKYGTGSLLIEKDCQFYGDEDHILSSVNAKNITISSAKDLVHQSVADLKLDSGAVASVNGTNQVLLTSKQIDLSSVGTLLDSTDENQVNIVASSLNSEITAKVNITAKEINLFGKTTIDGDLLVKGEVTNVESTNVLLKDNLMILNSGDEAISRDAGVMFNRPGEDVDNTTFFWDTTDNRFKFAFTNKDHTVSDVTVKSLCDVEFKTLYADSIESTGNKTITIELDDNRTDEYLEVPGLKTRGVYHFQIESLDDGGAVYDYKICKSTSANDAFTTHGVHQSASVSNEEVFVKWDSGKTPAIYHRVSKDLGTGAKIKYRVKYTTTD